MPYIKSYSNYVIKKKHQNINDGVIYERDFSTIGGVNRFSFDRTPIYQNGNFVFTVNNEFSGKKVIDSQSWFKNDGNEIWNLDNIVENTAEDSSLDIILKQDNNRIQDFAYFGSCSELVRASLLDIINKFPGELCVPKNISGIDLKVYYTEFSNSINDDSAKYHAENGVYPQKDFSDNGKKIVDNPFNINIHTPYINKDEVDNPLRYFANEGWKNYKIDGDEITSCTITPTNGCKKVGDEIATIVINGKSIKAYLGDENSVVYTTNSDFKNIRPKEEFYNNFFLNLDNFERVLMNKGTTPKYTATFEVMKESPFGYISNYKKFTFPTTFGDYNLAINNGAYETYLNDLVDIAQFYDELYCDNIYRSMTHEAIKNFDWTYEINKEEEDSYLVGSSKMQKALRLIGREFDEIKSYIDGIGNSNNLSYNESNNMPDYCITDAVNLEGWVNKNVYPLLMKELTGLTDVTSAVSEENRKSNSYNNEPLIRSFGEDLKNSIIPFSKGNNLITNGYKIDCSKVKECNIDCSEDKECNTPMIPIGDDEKKNILGVFYPYSSEKVYEPKEVNNTFMRNLKLNSSQIFNKKGTIDGIESLLALFGLRSKRFAEKVNCYNDKLCYNERKNNPLKYDYDIKEFVVSVNPIEDTWDDIKNMNILNFYNYTKTISYDTTDSINGIYKSYQGLPVQQLFKGDDLKKVNPNTDFKHNKYYELGDLPYGTSLSGISRTLYPYFNPNLPYDGEFYYQMAGGWLEKSPYKFDKYNNIITNDEIELFTETIKDIRSVDTIIDMLSLSYDELENGQIVKVEDLKGKYVIIDGIPYELQTESYDGENIYYYIPLNVVRGTITLGLTTFAGWVNCSMYGDKPVFKYLLSEMDEGSLVKVYLHEGKTMQCYNDEDTILSFQLMKDGVLVDNIDEDVSEIPVSHFYKVNNIDFKDEISENGWQIVELDSSDYLYLNSIVTDKQGNNPHSGHLKYDKGAEYIKRFEKLFKVALDENAFDRRCYNSDNDYYGAIETMNGGSANKCGFKILTDECSSYYDLENNSGITYCKDDVADQLKLYKIEDWCIKKKQNGTDDTTLYEKKQEQHKIINTKRVELTFYVYHELYSEEGVKEIKYLDDIVTNYLSQMIPSTLIMNINYVQQGEGGDSATVTISGPTEIEINYCTT